MSSRVMRLTAVAIVVISAAAGGCLGSKGPEAMKVPSELFGIGLQADMMKDYERSFAIMEEAGVRWVRVGAGWGKLEPEHGRFEWSALDGITAAARRHGMSVLVTITAISPWGSAKPPAGTGKKSYMAASPPKDMTSYSSFIETVISRYRGRGIAWQIENEPNAPVFWSGTRDQYLELLKTAYAAAHKADPAAVVLAAGMACGFSGKQTLERDLESIRSWYGAVMATGAFDALDAHDYYPIEADNPFGLTFRGYLQKVKGWMEAKGVDVPLWVTEAAISSAPFNFGGGTASFTPEQQAAGLKALYRDACQEGVSHVFWYKLVDTPEGIFTNMGLLAPDLSRKPAWNAYCEMTSASAVELPFAPQHHYGG